ncbi:MAG: histidine phosphatase family protein [Acidobacteriales bacterium]|nr:histidine phosphatase family protein [Terriglobales bacterium]
MEIYLQRHGTAEWGHTGLRDADRALTGEGIARLKSILKVARAAGVKPSLVLTSPYRRAMETAQLAVDILGYKSEPVRSDALKPMADPRDAWEEIRLHKNEESIYLAGHEPLFGRLTAFLAGAPSLQVDFKKGAIVRIDVDRFGAEPAGILKWMLVPKLATAAL